MKKTKALENFFLVLGILCITGFISFLVIRYGLPIKESLFVAFLSLVLSIMFAWDAYKCNKDELV
ncbi:MULTISPECIES: hypothetical protein [Bacillus]|uniref:hypothetical protein n=1 Tax=Bacillus TaxID=1386 RepID=UPI0002D761B9|nr:MULTISPECIES: hypothetical protein [Bacillus]